MGWEHVEANHAHGPRVRGPGPQGVEQGADTAGVDMRECSGDAAGNDAPGAEGSSELVALRLSAEEAFPLSCRLKYAAGADQYSPGQGAAEGRHDRAALRRRQGARKRKRGALSCARPAAGGGEPSAAAPSVVACPHRDSLRACASPILAARCSTLCSTRTTRSGTRRASLEEGQQIAGNTGKDPGTWEWGVPIFASLQ